MYACMSVYFHMAVYIFSCLSLFSFLSLWLQSLLLHNILELEPSWAELWVAWLLAWFALALGCATRLSQRDMQTQTNKAHTHAHKGTHIQTAHRQTRHTCSWPFPRSCSELFARLSLSSSLRCSAQRRRRRRQRSRRQQQRLRRSPVSLSFSAVLGIESATSEQRTTFHSQRQKAEEKQQTAAEISVEPQTKKETGVKNVWSKPSGERGERTNDRTELNWTEMQFITVIIIRHANDINDSIELKLKFNGI